MHYRNGREARKGDKIVKIEGGRIVAFGVLHSAVPGNDYCNGNIASIQSPSEMACLCDCLHVDDLAEILAEKGLDKRTSNKQPGPGIGGRKPMECLRIESDGSGVGTKVLMPDGQMVPGVFGAKWTLDAGGMAEVELKCHAIVNADVAGISHKPSGVV